MTVTCPNCGNEITAPKRKKKSIKCPYCDMGGLELGLDYFDENGNPKLSFSEKHPTLTKAGYLTLAAAGGVFLWWMRNKDRPIEEIDPMSFTSLENTPEKIIDSPIEEAETSTGSDLLPIDSEEAQKRLLHYDLQKRHLPVNQRASEAKRKEANDLGIDIGNEYTIVDSYDRPYRKKQEA